MKDQLRNQLEALGVNRGDLVLAHAAFRSLGTRDPEDIIEALLGVLGPAGTLLMPALSYLQEPAHIHDTRHTPTCVGYLTEYFRTRPGTRRSFHPTHSVCAVGGGAEAMLADHGLDTTPCGPNSPFNRLTERGGKILMIGCGLTPNTTMHAIEEHARPPYVFGPPREYILTDAQGVVSRKTYTTHGFVGYAQRYDRAAQVLTETELRSGPLGNGVAYLLDASALRLRAVEKMREEPFYFVDRYSAAGE